MTEVESWRVLDDGLIEFTMRRLRCGRAKPGRCLGSEARHGQRTVGGIEDRIESMLPPVFSPKIVPRS